MPLFFLRSTNLCRRSATTGQVSDHLRSLLSSNMKSFSTFPEGYQQDEEVDNFKAEDFINRVMLCGEVCWAPYDLKKRDTNEVFGFQFGIATKSLVHQSDHKFVKITRHPIKCFNRRYFDVIEALDVGSRVLIEGELTNRLVPSTSSFAGDTRRFDVLIQNLTVL